MLPTDSLSPYYLASMHPLMHLSLLVTSMILIGIDQSEFYQNPGTCPAGSPADKFMKTGKTQYMFTIMTAHLVAAVLHLLGTVLCLNNKFWANVLLIAKVLIYLYAVVFVQSGITYDECNKVTDQMPVMVWLTYEVIAFYLNLFGVVFFLLVSTFATFKNFRDRLGLAGDMRERLDFLKYSQDDLHWWQFWFCQLGLYIAGLSFRINMEDSLGLSATQAACLLVSGGILGKTFYFKSDFQFDTVSRTFFGISVALSLMLIPRYFWVREKGFLWWSPVVMELIVAHLMTVFQFLFEWATLKEKINTWKYDIIFKKEYEQKEDASETMLRDQINNLVFNEQTDNKIFQVDEGDNKKTLKLSATFFTATYFSLMKSNKAKFKMRESDQVELFWKCCFIYTIQIMFTYVIYAYANLKPTVERAPELHITLFFTVLMLHFTCMPVARDGLAMMKYALLHHDEFNHPISAFMLGFFNMSEMIFAELVNMTNSQTKKTVAEAVSSFIGFGIIIMLPQVYMNGIEDFPQKAAVGKLVQTRRRADKERPLMSYNKYFNFIYVLFAVFYKAVFFYFFPFGSSLVPFFRSLEGNITGNDPS